MCNKSLAAFSTALLFSCAVISMAQSPTPVATPAALVTPAVGPRAEVDALSQNDLVDVLNLLKSNYLNAASLTESELNRATLQGLLERLAPGVAILPKLSGSQQPSPFRSEILDGRIGYARLGSLTKSNLTELDAALLNFNTQSLKSVVLDLRATPAGSEFDLAAEVINRFCAKGKLLFTVKGNGARQDRIFTSSQEPSFQGIVVVLADRETAGAAEVITAVLRGNANAMFIGQKTAGQGVEFSDLPLHSGKILRVAVAEVALPGNVAIFPNGVKPDIAVDVEESTKRDVMQQSLDKGVSQFVFETERTHMNEAALVAGTNPEIDALQQAQRKKAGERSTPPLRDVALQRAVDAITSIGFFQNKPKTTEKKPAAIFLPDVRAGTSFSPPRAWPRG